ncbi:hypothetical protein U3516DRAFT_895981, partial [Neocallimastix sp. 'constans']
MNNNGSGGLKNIQKKTFKIIKNSFHLKNFFINKGTLKLRKNRINNQINVNIDKININKGTNSETTNYRTLLDIVESEYENEFKNENENTLNRKISDIHGKSNFNINNNNNNNNSNDIKDPTNRKRKNSVDIKKDEPLNKKVRNSEDLMDIINKNDGIKSKIEKNIKSNSNNKIKKNVKNSIKIDIKENVINNINNNTNSHINNNTNNEVNIHINIKNNDVAVGRKRKMSHSESKKD